MPDPGKLLGIPFEFEFEGQVYKASPLDFYGIAKFRRFLEQNAIKAVQRHRDILSDEEYEEQMDRVFARIGQMSYSLGSPAFKRAMRTSEGVIHLIWLMLEKNHPGIDKELVERMVMTQGRELMRLVRRANASDDEEAKEKENLDRVASEDDEKKGTRVGETSTT